MTWREELDGRMRAALLQLAVVSHVPAAQIGYSTGGSQHPSRLLTGGDLGNHYLAQAYGEPFHICDGHCRHRWMPATDDHAREQIVKEAEREVAHLRRGTGLTPAQREVLEQPDDTVQRMLKETAGWSPEEVERSRWRMSARMVRRYRRGAARNPETGQLLEDTGADADPAELRQRAQAMRAAGYRVSQIASLLGIHRNTARKYAEGERTAA